VRPTRRPFRAWLVVWLAGSQVVLGCYDTSGGRDRLESSELGAIPVRVAPGWIEAAEAKLRAPPPVPWDQRPTCGMISLYSDAAGAGASRPSVLERARAATRSRVVSKPGGLPDESVAGVVRRHEAELVACLREALNWDRSLNGRVVITVTIGPDGRVKDVTLTENRTGTPRLPTCTLRRVRPWIFGRAAAPTTVEVEVVYSLAPLPNASESVAKEPRGDDS